jgi:hypothetical protein
MSSKSTPRHPMTCLQKPSRRSAKVVMNAARYGERNPANLSAFAVNFGLRNWHLPKR